MRQRTRSHHADPHTCARDSRENVTSRARPLRTAVLPPREAACSRILRYAAAISAVPAAAAALTIQLAAGSPSEGAAGASRLLAATKDAAVEVQPLAGVLLVDSRMAPGV